MTKVDLAHLVGRGISLWIGVAGLIGAVNVVLTPRADGEIMAFALIPVLGALALWVATPVIARAFFAKNDDEVPLPIESGNVPAIAAFVIGLYTLVTAVPQAAAWIGVLILRSRSNPALMTQGMSPDERVLSSSISLFLQIVIGVALIVNSWRFRASYVDSIESETTDAE